MDALSYLLIGVLLACVSYLIIDGWNQAGKVIDHLLKELDDQSKHRGASRR